MKKSAGASPSRSPLKDKPLRSPAQSLEEERRELLLDKVMPYFLGTALLSYLAIMEWLRVWQNFKPNPVIYTGMAIVALVLTAWRIHRLRPRLHALQLGIEGEKVVGQYLERLRGEGYEVFHDVVSPGANVDHVLVGPAGIFTVETKTWSKPKVGDARIQCDGESITIAGRAPDRNPIVQARAQASWLKGVLLESTGKNLPVAPIVLFPGWFVENAPGSLKRIWVLEPKALPSFLQAEPRRLVAEDVKLASYHLSRFVRSGERERDPR